jgi:hypothetical protein
VERRQIIIRYKFHPPKAWKWLMNSGNKQQDERQGIADDPIREKMRVSMGETYHAILGHLRHEIGHYYWDKLVRDGGHIESCRMVFGDDSQDNDAALQHYYDQGAPVNWQENFVSAYATMRPCDPPSKWCTPPISS